MEMFLEVTAMIKKSMKIRHGESGLAVLGWVLILALVGALVLPALLYFTATASTAGQIVERKNAEYYSANSGIDAAVWRIKTDGKLDWLNGKWNESIYDHTPLPYESYTLSDNINGNSVVYQLTPKWVLDGIEQPDGPRKRNPAENLEVTGSYQGTGSSSGQGKYKINIYYDGFAGGLGISRIGCWLPRGFEYVIGSSSCENTSAPFYPYLVKPVEVADFRGGHTVIWNFSPSFDYNLLDSDGTQKKVTFEFTPNQVCQGEFSWVSDNNTDNLLAWTDVQVFEIKSTATSPSGQSTTATSYNTRNKGQAFGAAIEGDYHAFGSTLMRDTNDSYQRNRDRLYKETTSAVTAIPANAQVEKVFLYWTGWKCKPWTSVDPVGKQINKVACKVTVGGSTFSDNITSSLTQAQLNTESGSHGWTYSCYADITKTLKDFFKNQGVSYIGNGSYTVGHADFVAGSKPSTGGPWYALYNYTATTYPYSGETVAGYTRYPLGSLRNGGSRDDTASPYYEDYSSEDSWAYAAWSIIIVYTSPATLGHQLYRFDEFYYGAEDSNVTKTISGFVVPNLVDGSDAAKITCFVGEGDNYWNGDSIKVNGSTLSDSYNPSNNVWNSQSRIAGSTVQGIDIDTFNLSTSIVHSGDTTATVALKTGSDSWNLVYMILSFRSKISAGGTYIYELQ